MYVGKQSIEKIYASLSQKKIDLADIHTKNICRK